MRTLLLSSLVLLSLQTTVLAGDAERGQTMTKWCVACHNVLEPRQKIGPHLRGIVGRPIASVSGFAYSQAMKDYAAKNGNWDEAKLEAYMTNPQKLVPGIKMTFAGVPKAVDRADIIAYLKTLTP